ncbi:MAG: Asp-tRNA(Asn)/Glu-tRNA(Gln) amidotransferase subunit GatA [Phycisphaerae bacterium]
MNSSDAIPSAIAISAEVRAGRRRAEDVCAASLERIAARDDRIGAFLQVFRTAAMERARRVDARIQARGLAPGDLPLAGVPVAVKDNICTREGKTTCASRILADYRSPFDATVVARIEAAGGVILGKTNLDEFAMGSSTENSAVRPTRNPRNPEYVAGGSSGGSAAAVAAGMTPLALGSDTGGSVRLPAALCGVVGLKPTFGRVSRYGLVAFGSSLDQIGPLTTNVADAALLLGAIAGHDPHDSTSTGRPLDAYLAQLDDRALADRAGNIRIGLPREYFGEGLDSEVRAAVERAMGVYRKLGATTVDVSLPHTRFCIAAYYVIATAEASSNLARFDGVRYGRRAASPRDMFELYSRSRSDGLGAEVKRRIMLGTFALSSGYYDAYYARALKVRRLIQRDFEQAFAVCDVIACPTSPTPAFRIGEKAQDPLQMYLADVYTTAANLSGVPAVSLPCGVSRGGLPIGLQLMGPLFGESPVLQAARLYERETG